MGSFQLLPSTLSLPHLQFSCFLPFYSSNYRAKTLDLSLIFNPHHLQNSSKSLKLNPPRASVDGDGNGVVETPRPTRRGRKKGTTSPSSSSTATQKKTNRNKKSQITDKTTEGNSFDQVSEEKSIDSIADNYDDGMDIPYEDPPLICCFGAAQKEFVPSIRVHDNQMHPDKYSEWKMLQWDPPEFARAPGGSPSNVAISHVRLGGRAAFMGKVGKDDFGDELVLMMNKEKVQTRAVKFGFNSRTACTYMKIKFEDGKLKMETVKEPAEDSLLISELNLAVLKEARIFHFNSEVLLSTAMESTLFKAIQLSKKFGGLIFFDLNLPLPLWKSRDETREYIKKAWNEANIIEVSRQELEFLLDEEYYEKKRNYRPQYYAQTIEQTKNRRDHYHYTPEEISPLWHDRLKLLFVTDGTLRIHYYSPSFHGVAVGTEDVLITPFTCDRTGSGDAVVAGIMRKLTTFPEMLENQDVLERQLLPNIFKTLNKKLQFLLHQWHPYNATNQLIMSTASTSRSMTNNITIASAATSPTRSKVSSKATITARLHRQWRRCTTLPMPATASQLGQRRRRNTTRIKKEVCFIRSRMPFLTTAVTAAVTVTMKVTKPITTRSTERREER